jgi:hypothetical protein
MQRQGWRRAGALAAGGLLRVGLHHTHVGGRREHQNVLLQTAQKQQLNYLCKDILRQEPKSFATVAKSDCCVSSQN